MSFINGRRQMQGNGGLPTGKSEILQELDESSLIAFYDEFKV
ncbi:MAG: hypothetical protein WC634_01130 [archaeon]